MSGFAVLLGLVLLTMAEQTASHLSSGGPHIADVNILLPPKMTYPVEYRLQGSDGCFKWSWDHHDILSVLPEYNSTSHCSTSARLRSVAPYSGRKETAVYATDVKTGVVIRCKVFIDKLSRIQIFHNSVKLDLDGLATLQVRAFDSEENVFSSLVGLQFSWQLISETNVPLHHLVHVPLKDSPLSDCGGLCGDLDVQIKLEDSGVFSDMYVVKGVEIGHEIVSVHLLEPQFKHMVDEIILTVAEAMSLDPPSPVLVIIGAAVRYNLKVIRENKAQVVTLPSPHHQWSSSNSSVAHVDSMTGLTNALSLGATNIKVEDTRVTGHIQVSSLNVVLPDSLSLYMTPLSASFDPVQGLKAIPSMSRWFGVSGHQYLVQMKVFSQGPDAQEIYITENDDLKLSKTHSDYWQIFPISDDIAVKHSWQNSVVLKATSQGQGKLTASLTYFSGVNETKEVLKVVQEVTICDQVKFSLDKTRKSVAPATILLPWAPAIYQEMELKVSGGCAKASTDYKWYSSDMSIVSVSASGVVQAKKPGKATIKVLSIFDSFNYDEVVVEVSVPTSMSMLLNFPVETVVGSHLHAAVTMKASNGVYFHRCDAFSSFIKWKVGSGPFVIVKGEVSDLPKLGNAEFHTSGYGSPCSFAELYASASGRATLHATLPIEYHDFQSSFHGPIALKASSLIAAYPPLIVRQAGDGNHYGGYFFDLALTEADNPLVKLDKMYLVPGTHLNVMLLGGPEQWKNGVEFVETVEIINKEHGHTDDGASVQQLSENYKSLYRVSCEMLGTYNIVFKRGNLVGDDHPVPAVADMSLSLICSIPSSIALIADEPVNQLEIIRTAIQADRSSERVRVNPITVANNHTIRLAAVGISSNGEAFANSSSLHLQWELSSCDGMANWADADNLQRSKYSWENFLSLQNVSGVCIVRATVIGFHNTMGHHNTIPLLESSENVLTDAIRLQLVSTLRISPEFHLVVFNPNAKVNLAITGGSCFLKVVVNDSQVVEVIQPPMDLQCSQLVLSPKGLGTALVTVYDIGLAPPLAASSVVQVAEIDWIKIMSPEVICLMEGNSQIIDIMAGISDGKTFDSYQFAYISVQVHVEDQIIEVSNINDISNTGGGSINVPKFKIFGSHLGITTFFVSALQHSGHEIFSQPIMVEVYAAPEIHPHDIFLVPGASYVLTLKGGPTIGVNVEYTSMDDEVATIDGSSGRLSASLPGNTTIRATVLKNGDTVICQAYTSVKVGIPSSVILNAQSELLGAGNAMPLYPVFPEGDLFSVYEQCQNYHWSGEDEKVLSFHGLEHLNGGKYGSQLDHAEKFHFTSHISEEELGFIKVVLGRSAGRTNVAVSFSCEFVSSTSMSWRRIYNASVSILVVPDPPLALGVPITWILPPHYTTTSLLPLSDNRNHEGTIIYSLLKNVPNKNEVLQKDAIFIDGDRIKTSESNNLACIQAKDRRAGRIEIAACVKVAEVAQIRISDDWLPFRGINLVLGAELSLPIVYLDALGNRFYEAYDTVLFDVETDNPDVVSVNTTLAASGIIHFKAMRHGRALVRVSIADIPLKSDYILISVGAHIHPQNPVLHIGSHVNFSIEGLNDQISGRWLTANESVISVSSLSGESEVIGVGTTQVHFEASSMKLQTTVTVLTDDVVSVDAPRETLTNVPFPTKGYNFSVKISDKFKAFGNTKGLQYVCRVDPPSVGYSKPWVDLDTGNQYCLFFPYTPEHLVRFTSKEMKPDITVSVNASLRGADHVSGSASALFVGGFSVLEMGKDSVQLNLTPDSNKTIITIMGNTDVDIYWRDRDLLHITPIHKEGFGIGGRAKYEVKMIGTKRFKDTIFITLPANGQSVEIDVYGDPGEKKAAAETTTISDTLWPTILGGLALLIVIVLVFNYYSDKPDRSHVPFAPATPSTAAAPVTPARSSPGVVNELSPRTPQPFMDYVRRTIDETPYYRREPRRRVNPQNTF